MLSTSESRLNVTELRFIIKRRILNFNTTFAYAIQALFSSQNERMRTSTTAQLKCTALPRAAA